MAVTSGGGTWFDKIRADLAAKQAATAAQAPSEQQATEAWFNKIRPDLTQPPPAGLAPAGYGDLWDQSGHDPQRFAQAFIAQEQLIGKQADATSLNKIVAALKSVGVNAALDQRTDQYHKGITIDGQFVKMLDGGDNWIWQPAQSGGSEAGGGGGGEAGQSVSLGELSNGALARPYGQTYTPVVSPETLAATANAQYGKTYEAPEWTKLGPPAQWDKTFHAPTMEEVRNDPGYQFAREQGLAATDTSAAAKGTLLTSGNQKNRLQYATGLADQTYQQKYQNALGEYLTAYDMFNKDQNALTQRAASVNDQGRADFATNYNVFRGDQSDAFNREIAANDQAQNQFTTNYNVWRQDNNDIFGRYDSLAGRGLLAAGAATS